MSTRIPGGTPVRTTPRFDAENIERLHKIALEFNAIYASTPANRMDSIDAVSPSTSDMATMRAYYRFVDDSEIPKHYTDSPGFVCGCFAGSVRRSASAAYMLRKRTL